MLNLFARAHVGRVTDPIGRWLVDRGVTPDVVTVVGTAGTVAAALWFLPRGAQGTPLGRRGPGCHHSRMRASTARRTA